VEDFILQIIKYTVALSLFVMSISTILLLIRTIKGPTNPDRAIALDSIGINLVAMAALIAIQLKTTYFNEVILLIGILAFIGTIAVAKFIEKGVIIDNDRHNS
jgi:multicomponent Na+:H+ antiporter subunit F